MNFCPKCHYLFDIKKDKKLSTKITDKTKTLHNNSSNNIVFLCENCGHIKPVTKSIKLYELNKSVNIDTFSTLSDNKLICSDPILPRTRDYTCKNDTCLSHKKTESVLKEAVYYRTEDTYNVHYVCCVCHFSWEI